MNLVKLYFGRTNVCYCRVPSTMLLKKGLPCLFHLENFKEYHRIGKNRSPSTHIEHVASIDVNKSSEVRTKAVGIICTIGPASRDVKTLMSLMQSGMNIARLNFSHGTHEYHLQTLRNIKTAEAEYSKLIKRIYPIGIALDTKGPEIRDGALHDQFVDYFATGADSLAEAHVFQKQLIALFAEGCFTLSMWASTVESLILPANKKRLEPVTINLEDPLKVVHLKEGSEVTITTDEKFMNKVTSSRIYIDYKKIGGILTPGSLVYVDDGIIRLIVTKIVGNEIKCTVENGGALGSKKGVNLPGIHIDLPSVSPKDRADIGFALKHGIDMIFASFVQDKSCILDIRKITRILEKEAHKEIAIIAKIENNQGLENLDDIIEAADGVMVARGDLGIEIPLEKVFLAQKSMIAKCNLEGKPIICATQMLDSMETKSRPTRAETSDVANAVLDGADCVMLSGETAKGLYPVECVNMMARICREAEAVIPYRQMFMDLQKMVDPPTPIGVSTAIAGVAAAEKSSAACIMVVTTSGDTANMVARFRPPCPIIAITRYPEVARKGLLYRGVVPAIHVKELQAEWAVEMEARILTGLYVGYHSNIIHEDDTVIFLTGWKKGRGSTNTMRILKVTKEKIDQSLESYSMGGS